jgi:DNA-directed RNA polymerase specialized sigma24 family protein
VVQARIRRIVGQDADDLVPELFVRFLRSRPEERKAAPWILSTSTSLAIERLRLRVRRDSQWQSQLEAARRETEDLPALLARPELLRRVLADLDRQTQAVVVLVRFEELSAQEATVALGLARAAIDERLARFIDGAATLLRRKMAPDGSAGPPAGEPPHPDHRHVPPYLIDRLLAGILPAEVAGAVGRQEQSCIVCRLRLAEARQEQTEFLARNPPARRARELLDQAARASRRRRLAWSLPAVSALGLAVFSLARGLPGSADERRASSPAQPSLRFTVERPGSPGPRPGQSGERLRHGDAVKLHLDAGRFLGAHVFSLDEQGQVQPLFDWSPATGSAPPSLVLDDSPQSERIVVLFHDLPDPALELPRLREAIARAQPGLAGGEQDGPTVRPADGREIVTGSFLIRKERSADAGMPDAARSL